jgi:hypothetical protein
MSVREISCQSRRLDGGSMSGVAGFAGDGSGNLLAMRGDG